MTRNIYNILRLDTQIKSRRLKLLGIWLFHVLGKRYIGVFLDPVQACNFRCKMCYFSDEEKRKSLRDRKSTRLNSSHRSLSRMPSSA